MTIRDKRFQKAIYDALRQQLNEGNLPSSNEFISHVNAVLQESDLLKPFFRHNHVRRGSKTSSAAFNKMMNAIYEDLALLYETAVEQHNESSKVFNKFQNEKERLNYEVSKVENELQNAILLHSKSGFLNSVFDVFDDLDKIDMEKTSAEIDIKQKEALIPNIKNRSHKIVQKPHVSFQPMPEASRLFSENIHNDIAVILDENIDTTWKKRYISKNRETIAGYLYFDFTQRQRINRIELHLSGSEKNKVRIEFTGDDINWFALPYHEKEKEVFGHSVFDFPEIEVTRIRVLIIKESPDKEIHEGPEKTGYEYVFGVSEVGFYNLQYAVNADLYSDVLQVPVPEGQSFTIDKVSLLVEEDKPNGTDIAYKIGLPAESGQIQWKDISPVNHDAPDHNQIIDYKNIARSPADHLMISEDLSLTEFEKDEYYANGITFYKIGEVENRSIIKGTDRLYVGANTWGVKEMVGELPNHTSHLPELEDWQSPIDTIRQDYKKIEDGRPGMILNKKQHSLPCSYQFKLGVFTEKKEDLVTAIPTGTDPVAIYMNGEKIFQGIPSASNQVSYLFKNGWNEITVFVYVRETVGSVNGSTVDLHFDPREYGSNVYSKAKPLERVPLFDLRHNVKSNDHSKYAVVEKEGYSEVILNHAVPGLTYDFFYDYAQGNIQDEILLWAHFTRNPEASSNSPKLKGYRIRFS